MRPLSARHPQSLRAPKSPKKHTVEDGKEFATLFSHSGAIWLAGVAKGAIEGAKARLRVLGIDPEDPSSEDEDPTFKLS